MEHPQELEILFVEDSETDARLVVHALRRCGFAPTWRRVETAPDLREALLQQAWRLVISDSSVPQLGAFEALALTRSITPTLPFIVVSGSIHPDAARQAIEAGADAWISKDDLTPLGDAVRRGLGTPRAPEPTLPHGLRRSTARTLECVIAPLVTAARDAVAQATPRAALNHAVAMLDDATARLIALGRALGEPADGATLETPPSPTALTPRQLEVLRLMADGATTREIAGVLGLSVKTIETHRGQIMERLGIRSVAGLVRYALRVGLVPLDG